jgi:hypothetical protein
LPAPPEVQQPEEVEASAARTVEPLSVEEVEVAASGNHLVAMAVADTLLQLVHSSEQKLEEVEEEPPSAFEVEPLE